MNLRYAKRSEDTEQINVASSLEAGPEERDSI